MNSNEIHFIVWFSHWLDRILILFYFDDYVYEWCYEIGISLPWIGSIFNGKAIITIRLTWHRWGALSIAHAFVKHEIVPALVILLYVLDFLKILKDTTQVK